MDNKTIYEKFDWGAFKSEVLKEKVSRVIQTIPEEVGTIIDIGCGNGLITNVLGQKYNVTAVDRSKYALSFVKTKKINSSSDDIPVEDNSFDMVFSSELLEHLNDEVLAGTVSEIKRISKKYIFITVPNDENPDKLSIKCPECDYVYNSPNHLRTFDLQKLHSLFSEYRLISNFTFGKKVRFYNINLLKIKRKWSPSASWIPYYWMPKEKRSTNCPSCEHSFINNYSFNPVAFGIDIINTFVSPKKPYWLFAVFERK